MQEDGGRVKMMLHAPSDDESHADSLAMERSHRQDEDLFSESFLALFLLIR